MTAGYDPDDVPRPRSTWYAVYDQNGKTDSGPTPMPDPSPDADAPPDEPHIVG